MVTEAGIIWFVTFGSILLTTALLSYLVFVRREINSTNWKKMVVGGLGAVLPAVWASSFASAEAFLLWDRIFLVAVVMVLWGTTFGGLLVGLILRVCAVLSREELVKRK